MERNLIAYFVLVIAVVFALCQDGESIPAKATLKEQQSCFIFLVGSSKQKVRVQIDGLDSVNFVEHNYWMSVERTGYAEANKCCQAQGKTLVQFETEEEFEAVKAFISDMDTSRNRFWVGARYLRDQAKYVWESGVDILDNFWQAGEPSLFKPNSRVAAIKTLNQTNVNVQLQSRANTEPTWYICEGL